jgi:hypothetical protein
MIDEMMLVFDSPGRVSKVFIIALLSRDPINARGADTGHKQRKCAARFFVRSVTCAPNWLAAESVSAKMPAASLQGEIARARPMPNYRKEPMTEAVSDCAARRVSNDCPALGMYARMRSPLDSLSHCQCEKRGLRKSMKLQPSGHAWLTLPPFGMTIAIQLDENTFPTWRTVGF